MGGISSMIILPPVGPRPERVAPGPVGEPAFREISAVQRIAPPRQDARARQSRPDPGDSERSREGGNREVRELTVRSASDPFAKPFAGARFASTHFLVQMLSQGSGAPPGPLAQHRDGAALGSAAYRRAGAEPAYYSDQPGLFRIAV